MRHDIWLLTGTLTAILWNFYNFYVFLDMTFPWNIEMLNSFYSLSGRTLLNGLKKLRRKVVSYKLLNFLPKEMPCPVLY